MEAEPSQGEFLRRLEERLLNPGVRRCLQDFADLLADEFVEFGSSGPVFNKRQIIESLQDEEPAPRSMAKFRLMLLAPGVHLDDVPCYPAQHAGRPANVSAAKLNLEAAGRSVANDLSSGHAGNGFLEREYSGQV